MEDLLALGKDILLRLIGFLEEASPFLWVTLRKQVMVQAIQDTIGVIVCIGIAVILYRLFKHANKKRKNSTYDYDLWTFTLCVAAFFGTVALVIASIFFSNVVARLINPDWYAIQLLLQQF